MKIKYINDIQPYYNYLIKDENQREINIYKLDNCILTGINLFYPNVLILISDSSYSDILILPVIEKTMSLNISSVYEKYDMNYIENISRNINIVENNPLFFFIYNTDNYYHYIYDTLPYLITYFELKKSIPNIKLLMQYPNENKKNIYPFVIEFLNILGIDKKDIIMCNKNIMYKELYISTSYTHDLNSNLPPRKEIYELYKKIVDNVLKLNIDIKTPKKFYVSRRSWIHNDFSNIGTNYTNRRKIMNEDEIVLKLLEDGYVEVFTEKLTTIEKILYFYNATNIVGAIGGGISNVLFSQNTTKLLVLVSPYFLDINYRFKYSLDCVDVIYNYNSVNTEDTELKSYMRVKTKDDKYIGEIITIDDINKKILISYTNGENTGWNYDNKYKTMECNYEDIIKLDNGLNSPWIIKIDNI